jgi:hypothetical protein
MVSLELAAVIGRFARAIVMAAELIHYHLGRSVVLEKLQGSSLHDPLRHGR